MNDSYSSDSYSDSDDYIDYDIVDGGISIKEGFDRLKAFVSGTRKNWPPAARKVLAKYGDMSFSDVMVCRKPIDKSFQEAVKLFKKGNANYDKFFHLSLRFKMENGEWLRLDKREILHAAIDNDMVDTECIPVYVTDKTPSTINGIIASTLKKVGKERFFRYKATSFNCQRFVLDLIESNDMVTDKSFILQNVKDLLPGLVEKVADFFTDVASRFSFITQGSGMYNGPLDPVALDRLKVLYHDRSLDIN